MDRKRGRHEHAFNGTGNGASKKFRPPSASEMESFPTGLGSKLKPCTKFFSTSGCPFGEGCHFLHYVPGGIKTVQMMNTGSNTALPQVSRTPPVPPSFPDGSSPPMVKTRLCNKYNSSEGCKFGDKCHFAHGEWEIGKPTMPSYDDRQRIGGRVEPPAHGAAAGFGASATAKISINASLAGAVIGKNGINSKQICRVTGAKLSIREHDSDPNLKNIELEGSFDQIKQASSMVHELILNVSSAAGPAKKNVTSYGPGSNNFKTKLCEKFTKGSCTFGEKCHFAHGIEELRKSGM